MTNTRTILVASAVHTFTASGAVIGLVALHYIAQQELVAALPWMFLTLIIDGLDGPMARKIKITDVMPYIDGKVIDSVVDFFNYAIVPAFFLLNMPGIVDSPLAKMFAALIALSSCYWYGRVDQTNGAFCFKRFPCMWNVVIGYLFLWQASPLVIYAVVSIFVVLTFVPFSYPKNFSMSVISNKVVRGCSILALAANIVATVFMIFNFPERPSPIMALAMVYWLIYLSMPFFVNRLTRSL